MRLRVNKTARPKIKPLNRKTETERLKKKREEDYRKILKNDEKEPVTVGFLSKKN
jgi:hypothetical protein